MNSSQMNQKEDEYERKFADLSVIGIQNKLYKKVHKILIYLWLHLLHWYLFLGLETYNSM